MQWNAWIASQKGGRGIRRGRRKHLKRMVLVVILMVTILAIPFYRIVTSIPVDDPYPAKTTTELLDALESQIIEPGR